MNSRDARVHHLVDARVMRPAAAATSSPGGRLRGTCKESRSLLLDRFNKPTKMLQYFGMRHYDVKHIIFLFGALTIN